jgi:tetratricopeptide (TPR) repeat protein
VADLSLDRALLLKPEDPESYFVRALLIEHQGDREQAIKALETAVTLKADYHQAYTELSRLLAAEGQVQKAAQIEAKAAADIPDGRDDVYDHILFQLKSSSGEPDGEEEDARKTKQ